MEADSVWGEGGMDGPFLTTWIRDGQIYGGVWFLPFVAAAMTAAPEHLPSAPSHGVASLA